MPTLTQRLSAAWQRSVDDHQLINKFRAATNDPDGRWRTADIIAFGIRQQRGKNAYYAQNLTQSRSIPGAVEEKTIPGLGLGTGLNAGLDFVCQYNGYRALRPGGEPKPLGRQADISPEPERCRFSCQDASNPLSLLVRKPLVEVPLKNYVWKAYYNAAPIDPDGHYLWVPSDRGTLTHYPQRLSLAFLEDVISLFQQLDSTLLFFNSLHSGASVNHIHFQAIAHRTPLLAEVWPLTPSRNHAADSQYAFLDGYPASVMAFPQTTAPSDLFKHIDALQQKGIPFNLMFTDSRTLLVPRNIDHEIVSEFQGNGIAALGMCGKIITVDYRAYARADQSRIESAFKKMTLKPLVINS